MINELFNVEDHSPILMDKKEFFEKTKVVLSKIANSYSTAWYSEALNKKDFPSEDICEKCTGCGIFKLNGIESQCFQDKEGGWCYYRFCDYEQVSMELENHLEDIYDLLSVENIT